MRRGVKLSVDSYHTGLGGAIGLPWQGAVTTLRNVAFSSCKAVLAAKKEANYCLWDSY